MIAAIPRLCRPIHGGVLAGLHDGVLAGVLAAFVIGFAASDAGGRFAMHDQRLLDADIEAGLHAFFGAVERLDTQTA
jgi:hypothetical protein